MTNSSPVVGTGLSYTMVKLSNDANSTVPSSSSGQLSSAGYYTDNTTGGYGYSTGDFPTHYYPGWKPYPYYPYTNGYTCPGCGTWVYYGNYHNCYPKTVISYPVYVQQPVDLTPLLEKLDELTEEVKKLRKKQKKG